MSAFKCLHYFLSNLILWRSYDIIFRTILLYANENILELNAMLNFVNLVISIKPQMYSL